MNNDFIKKMELFFNYFMMGLSKADNEIMQSESHKNIDAQQSQTVNQGRYQLAEKFMKGVRDEQYVRYFYNLLEGADKVDLNMVEHYVPLEDIYTGDELDEMYRKAFNLIEFVLDSNGNLMLDNYHSPIIKQNSINELAKYNLKPEFLRNEMGVVEHQNGQPVVQILLKTLKQSGKNRLTENNYNIGGQDTSGLVYVKNDRQQLDMFDFNPKFETSITYNNQLDCEEIKGVYYNLNNNELLIQPMTEFNSMVHRQRLSANFERLKNTNNLKVTTIYGKIQNFDLTPNGYVIKENVRLYRFIINKFNETPAKHGPKPLTEDEIRRGVDKFKYIK